MLVRIARGTAVAAASAAGSTARAARCQTAAPFATPWRGCSPASSTYSRSCASAVAPRCGSLPSSSTAPPCATTSSPAVRCARSGGVKPIVRSLLLAGTALGGHPKPQQQLCPRSVQAGTIAGASSKSSRQIPDHGALQPRVELGGRRVLQHSPGPGPTFRTRSIRVWCRLAGICGCDCYRGRWSGKTCGSCIRDAP
jgi:hypothetical protein